MASKEIAENSEDVIPLDDSGKKSKKKLLMIIVPIVLLLGGGAGAYFTGMLDGILGKKPAAEEHALGEEHSGGEHVEAENPNAPKLDEHGKPIPPAFLKMPDMIVNLNSEGGAQKYLRLAVQLELESAEDQAAVEAVLPRVVDQFQTYLRELRVQDLRGSKGIYRLQLELLSRVNQAAAPIVVKDVLFQEILIQ